MKDKQSNDTFSNCMMIIIIVLLMLESYWCLAPILSRFGLTWGILDFILLNLREYFENPLKLKGFLFALMICAASVRTGKKVHKSWKHIIVFTVIGTVLYFPIIPNPIIHSIMMFGGMGMSIYGYSLIFRKIKGSEKPDADEGFDQNKEKMENEYSINIPYKFVYQKKQYNGWINCINPFRASMVLGSPGSGKSFAIYNAFIEQTIRKNYTMFLYDYKFPDLTERVITEIAYQKKKENLWSNTKMKMPKLYVINFDDPMKSNRCNPIHHSYITDPADTTEIADLVFKNINKGADGKGFDFFNESAKVYLDALIWFLANYDPDAVYELDADGNPTQNVIGSRTKYKNKGKYCTFPHVIELMAYNYQKVFQILQFTKGLEAKISPFASALEGGAMEQLQGQIASAQIPMGKFVSPALYWVMTGDDFTLDINNPSEPKIVCMGNNPDRQTIYGTTLALYTSRMFKLINHKGMEKSVVLLDELPTVFIKGLDNLIATARSNKVAIVLGAQDKSQLRRDYGDKEADVIMTTVGNLFSGSVEGRTAKDISESFGKQFRKRISESIGEESDSQSISYQLEDILPASKIMDMSQGTFCGWVKDNFGEEISQKKFYGAVQVDAKRNKALKEYEQGVPYITDLFKGTIPQMTKFDRQRLELLFPKYVGNEKKLQQEYLKEKVNICVAENFKNVKNDIERIVEAEFNRTTPFAEAYRESRESN